MKALEKISKIMSDYSLLETGELSYKTPLLERVAQKMQQEEKLTFILPAFPAKSPSPEKTSGALPDFGEVLALQNLQELCDRIEMIYPPGAEVIICSDGRVFSDVVNVSDEDIDRYNDEIKNIIEEYKLSSLSVFAMDDLYPTKSPDELRDLLFDFYAMDIGEVRELVKTSENYRKLFNGIHRFLFEDALYLNASLSKSQLHRETKNRAYELMRRSDAWSGLLGEHFRDALRLSIHPHPLGHEKFGIKLVPSSNKWATPWHNVVVKIKDRFELMHRKEAELLNATLKLERDRYAYFEVPAV